MSQAKTPRFGSERSLTTNAFEAAYKKFAQPLMKFIVKRMGGEVEAAEEVFSRTIVASWEGWNAFEHKSTFFTWICRIALNKIADYYREQINKRSLFIAPLLEDIAQFKSKEPTPEEKLALHELRASIRACILLLPEDKRELLFLRYWKKLTIKQIAKQFNISERAIEGRIYRAKQTLGQIIASEHPEIAKVYDNSIEQS